MRGWNPPVPAPQPAAPVTLAPQPAPQSAPATGWEHLQRMRRNRMVRSGMPDEQALQALLQRFPGLSPSMMAGLQGGPAAPQSITFSVGAPSSSQAAMEILQNKRAGATR
jgi:hypothetical protein